MTTPDFTDAQGNVFLDGQEEPRLRAVGFMHRHPCEHHGPQVQGTPISLGAPYVCDCAGTVLIGWRYWWPLPDESSESLLIDLEWTRDSGHAETPPEEHENGSDREADQ